MTIFQKFEKNSLNAGITRYKHNPFIRLLKTDEEVFFNQYLLSSFLNLKRSNLGVLELNNTDLGNLNSLEFDKKERIISLDRINPNRIISHTVTGYIRIDNDALHLLKASIKGDAK